MRAWGSLQHGRRRRHEFRAHEFRGLHPLATIKLTTDPVERDRAPMRRGSFGRQPRRHLSEQAKLTTPRSSATKGPLNPGRRFETGPSLASPETIVPSVFRPTAGSFAVDATFERCKKTLQGAHNVPSEYQQAVHEREKVTGKSRKRTHSYNAVDTLKLILMRRVTGPGIRLGSNNIPPGIRDVRYRQTSYR